MTAWLIVALVLSLLLPLLLLFALGVKYRHTARQLAREARDRRYYYTVAGLRGSEVRDLKAEVEKLARKCREYAEENHRLSQGDK